MFGSNEDLESYEMDRVNDVSICTCVEPNGKVSDSVAKVWELDFLRRIANFASACTYLCLKIVFC